MPRTINAPSPIDPTKQDRITVSAAEWAIIRTVVRDILAAEGTTIDIGGAEIETRAVQIMRRMFRVGIRRALDEQRSDARNKALQTLDAQLSAQRDADLAAWDSTS